MLVETLGSKCNGSCEQITGMTPLRYCIGRDDKLLEVAPEPDLVSPFVVEQVLEAHRMNQRTASIQVE